MSITDSATGGVEEPDSVISSDSQETSQGVVAEQAEAVHALEDAPAAEADKAAEQDTRDADTSEATDPTEGFENLGLPSEVLKAITKVGFETPSPTCADGTPAPDGTCLRPASVQWLPDLLPDPREVDRTDGDAVCSAYIITHDTWDASMDVTNAYASIRASVYETPDLQRRHTPTPDLEKGQGEFLPLIPNHSHTTVTIDRFVTEGKEPYPDRTPGKWERLVTYTRTYADNSHEPIQAFVFLTLTQQDDGTWAVTDAKWQQNH